MQTFKIGRTSFTWSYCEDSLGLPWKEHDGHGVIREAEASTGYSTKEPREVILHDNGRTIWLYDVQASIKLAKQYGWGVSGNNAALLQEKLGRYPSKKQITAEAVRLDIEFCRKFLQGDVRWFTVSCWKTNDPDNKEYMGGVLCEDGDAYLESVA
jgi:hypothetical protein